MSSALVRVGYVVSEGMVLRGKVELYMVSFIQMGGVVTRPASRCGL